MVRVWIKNYKDRRWHQVDYVGRRTRIVNGERCLAPDARVVRVVRKGKRFWCRISCRIGNLIIGFGRWW